MFLDRVHSMVLAQRPQMQLLLNLVEWRCLPQSCPPAQPARPPPVWEKKGCTRLDRASGEAPWQTQRFFLQPAVFCFCPAQGKPSTLVLPEVAASEPKRLQSMSLVPVIVSRRKSE